MVGEDYRNLFRLLLKVVLLILIVKWFLLQRRHYCHRVLTEQSVFRNLKKPYAQHTKCLTNVYINLGAIHNFANANLYPFLSLKRKTTILSRMGLFALEKIRQRYV